MTLIINEMKPNNHIYVLIDQLRQSRGGVHWVVWGPQSVTDSARKPLVGTHFSMLNLGECQNLWFKGFRKILVISNFETKIFEG